MASDLYQQIWEQIQKLTREEQQQLRDDIDKLLDKPKKHTILEFRGMAKGFWKDVDIDKYIEEERRSWDKEENI